MAYEDVLVLNALGTCSPILTSAKNRPDAPNRPKYGRSGNCGGHRECGLCQRARRVALMTHVDPTPVRVQPKFGHEPFWLGHTHDAIKPPTGAQAQSSKLLS